MRQKEKNGFHKIDFARSPLPPQYKAFFEKLMVESWQEWVSGLSSDGFEQGWAVSQLLNACDTC